MRRVYVTLMFCAVFLSVGATPVHAISWQWIAELSGPGPFRGWALDWRLVCLTDKAEKPVKITTVTGIIGSACSYEKGEHRRASIDLNFGFLRAKGDARFADGKEIRLTTLEPAFSWHVWGPVEAGTGVGVYWFSSESFTTVNRVMLEPVRVDLRPLRLNEAQHDWWREVLTLRFGWIVIPGGFEPNDFHAAAGTARRITSEFVRTWSVFIDGEPIIRKIKGQW